MFNLQILIADDHPLFLRGISDFLQQLGFMKLIMAKDGLEALQKLQDHQPDIAILDIEMPYLTGIEVAQKAKQHRLPVKIILISYQRDSMIVNMAEELNISGYLLKEDSLFEIEKCIHNLQEGKSYFSNAISNVDGSIPSESPLKLLTQTEKKVLKMISQNFSSKDIALKYGVSIRTIEKHRSNIIDKLGLDSKPTSLLLWAIENQIYL